MSREEKYIRLQKKVASLRSEVALINGVRGTISAGNIRPKLKNSLREHKFNWVRDSELVKQIELEAENGNAMNEDEIRNVVAQLINDLSDNRKSQLINDLSGGRKSTTTTYELAKLEFSVAAELTKYQEALLLYHQRQSDESRAIEMERLDSRASELRKEIEELDLLINAMEKT